ncbi:MAG: MFS transporter [Clostridiales bacterium]|nr:MFS transporter [Clostridiales bacterium]
MYLLLLALIYLAFISLGLPDPLLGSGWPTMREVFNVPISYMGIVSFIICGGTICSSLVSERLTKKFGTRYVTVVSVFMTAAALFGFSLATEFWMLCLWAIPYGLGAGAIDAALNNYVALHYNSRHMSWLHCFWGVGTIISPYVMSWALTNSVWNDGYRMTSGIQFAIAVILVLTLPVWKVNKSAADEEETNEVIGIKGALKIKGVPYLLLGFLGYCAAESTTMLWASSYLVEAREISKEVAAAFGSLFFIGITAGRFLAGFISEKFGDRQMIRIGTGVILAGVLCLLLPVETDLFALAGLIIIGFGCAPVYPSIIHSTPANFGAKNSQAIIGIQMASAYVGSTFMPPIFGLLANHVSIKLFPVYLLIFFVMMIIMVEKTFKRVQTD